jgi:serine/threonine protein kinase
VEKVDRFEDLTVVAQSLAHHLNLEYGGVAGQGNFKQTFRVQARDGSYWALKVFKAGHREERDEREIRAMRTCNHPFIARLQDINLFEEGGKQYLYMIEEYLAGGTLSAHLNRTGLMPRQAVVDLGSRLIDAVGHIASHGFVHRDIKPDNIMLRDDISHPVIVDFGLVRDLSATSITVDWLPRGPGSPYFSAPEQLNNAKLLIDWRTDQFALGVVLALCAFNRHPYHRDSPAATVEAIAQHLPLDDEFLRMARQNDLQILEHMVKPWPVQRFRSPTQLAVAWSRGEGK